LAIHTACNRIIEELKLSLLKSPSEYSNKWIAVEQMLPYLTQIPNLCHLANVYKKHSFIKVVFKNGLIFKEGAFGTHCINLCS